MVAHLAMTAQVLPVTRASGPMPEAGWFDPSHAGAAIVHAAGRSGAMQDAEIEAEVARHLDLFRALRTRGWRGRLMLLSSAAVYGDAEDPTPETAPLLPVNAYGRMKLAVEQGLAGIVPEVSLLRLSNIYGSPLDLSRRRVAALLLEAALSGQPFTTYGPGTSLRDYLHVDDFCRAVARALAAPAGVWNIGSGTGVSLNDLIARVEAVSGCRLFRSTGPERPEPKSSILEIARARAVLGWSPEVALDEGLARLLAAMGGPA
jgi:UDP-glucose 4-epimerase